MFLEIFIGIFKINNTNTGYITKQNTGHDSIIPFAADLIYNDNYILILLNIFYTYHIDMSLYVSRRCSQREAKENHLI